MGGSLRSWGAARGRHGNESDPTPVRGPESTRLAHEYVLEELACAAARAAVDVPGEPLGEPQAGAGEDLRVERLGVVDDDDHRGAVGEVLSRAGEDVGHPVDVLAQRTPRAAAGGRADLGVPPVLERE